jgi:hypothetical protein
MCTGDGTDRNDLHAAIRGQDCLPPEVADVSCLLYRSVNQAIEGQGRCSGPRSAAFSR